MIRKESLLIFGAGALFFILLAIRAYGYYTNDQSIFLLFADAQVKTGTFMVETFDGQTRYGNFHPPLVMFILAFFLRMVSWYTAPVLLLLMTMGIALIFLMKAQKDLSVEVSRDQRWALLLLFFLIPMTHKNALFLDIDNTVLVAWSAMIVFAIQRVKNTLSYHLYMGVLFALGFWCKLTTPPVVLILWCALEIIRRHTIKGFLMICVTAATSIILFVSSYAVVCLLMDLPFGEPFIITFGKFLGNCDQASSPLNALGNGFRSIYHDMHWFTPVLYAAAVYVTINEIKKCIISKKILISLYAHVFFWMLYLGYTFVVPTGLLPRYKFSMTPYLIWMLLSDFSQFIRLLSARKKWILTATCVLSVFLLPDFATSAMHFKLRYHWFSLLPVPFDYNPEWFVGILENGAAWAQSVWWGLPFRVLFFLAHYWSMGMVYLLVLFGSVSVIVYLSCKSIINTLFCIALPLWGAIFIQDMSREYQLFYDGGYGGFEQTTEFLKKNLQPDERFLGYRDLSFYTEHDSYSLYYWKDNRVLDTAYIDSISKAHSIRYIAFLNDNFYDNKSFKYYLDKHCELVFTYKDYRVFIFKDRRNFDVSRR